MCSPCGAVNGSSIEAPPKTPLTPEALRIFIPKIRGAAVWLNVEKIIQHVLDITLSPARSRRMWLNQIVADEGALDGPELWTLLVKGATLKPGDEITLGLDPGRSRVGVRLIVDHVVNRADVDLSTALHTFGPG